jgi:hypothetical protein
VRWVGRAARVAHDPSQPGPPPTLLRTASSPLRSSVSVSKKASCPSPSGGAAVKSDQWRRLGEVRAVACGGGGAATASRGGLVPGSAKG